jgi:transcriptional regulator with XRE-family HTH domain
MTTETADDTRAILSATNLRQGAMAARLGVSHRTLAGWASGANEPDEGAQVLLSILRARPHLVTELRDVGGPTNRLLHLLQRHHDLLPKLSFEIPDSAD